MIMLDGHYQRWQDQDIVERFAAKGVGEFFRSETRFLECHGKDVASVLDIGCASGRMLDLLRGYSPSVEYTGVDIVPENIERAKRLYPEARFHLANALEFSSSATFSLVNATGVCQHEPRFEDLIRRMFAWSERYVLFDVKFAAIRQHLIDIDRSYCAVGDHRLYYVLHAWRPFLDFLLRLPGIALIDVFGYETPPSAAAVFPSSAGNIVSAGIYLVRGDVAVPEVRLRLPSTLLDNPGA
jgi:SAM-dependent methyltransferase